MLDCLYNFFTHTCASTDEHVFIVIGDMMLDKITTGAVKGIANEAPVPVFWETANTYLLGGSANVCANLAALGGKVYPIGLRGDDSAGQIMEGRLADICADTCGLVTDCARPTTLKHRYYVNKSLVFRADNESVELCSRAIEDALYAAFMGILTKVDGKVKVVFSDYAKGTLTPALLERIIKFCKERDISTFVDPKRSLAAYHGCTFMKPNAAETFRLGGIKVSCDTLKEAHAGIRAQVGCRWSLITMAENGMSLGYEDASYVHKVPIDPADVIDVTGAGDVVLSIIVFLWDRGLPYEICLDIANGLGRAAVMHHGTYIINAQDLAHILFSVAPPQKSQTKVIFTNGCFDIVHVGHLTLLAAAKALGTHLIVGLNSDVSVRRLKGPSRPIQSQEKRAAMLMALPWVDEVCIFDEDTPERLLAELRPAILVKGGDYKPEQVLGREYVSEVVIIPFVEGNSTTSIAAAAAAAMGTDH